MTRTKITVPQIVAMKETGEKITALTAYDYIMAKLLDEVGIEIILVGDSCAMVFGGNESTLAITVDEMIYHTRVVKRGLKRALLVADLPFLSFQVTPEQALHNAGRFFKEASAEAVKIEGGAPMVATIQRLVQAGMPVMGHLGLTPQSVNLFGGYKLQATRPADAEKLLADAIALEQAGVFAIVLEKIPAELAKQVTGRLRIPTIGIGAGPHCDGQILVTHDILGLFEEFKPKFVRRYADLAHVIKTSCSNYAREVKTGQFPSMDESF